VLIFNALPLRVAGIVDWAHRSCQANAL